MSPECRTPTVIDLAKMRETTAYDWFKRLRWPQTQGGRSCPKCGTLRCHTMSQRRFKCSEKTCKEVFSVTSGTVFHSRICVWVSIRPCCPDEGLMPKSYTTRQKIRHY